MTSRFHRAGVDDVRQRQLAWIVDENVVAELQPHVKYHGLRYCESVSKRPVTGWYCEAPGVVNAELRTLVVGVELEPGPHARNSDLIAPQLRGSRPMTAVGEPYEFPAAIRPAPSPSSGRACIARSP